MIDRRTLLNNLKLIFQPVDRVNLSWRVGEVKNEISIRIESETRGPISEYHLHTDVVLNIIVSYIFEASNIDDAIETKRIALITQLMNNKISLLSAGFILGDEIRVSTGVVDDNSGYVVLEFQVKYKDDIY